MIELDNQTELDVDIEALEKIASLLTDAPIELIITDNETIRELNARYREKDKPTDVLSFPLEQAIPGMPLGSIVISETYVREKAVEFGHTPDDELTLLFIHGLLHLLGYDHEVDNGEMRAKEQEFIEQFHLPKSLIVRTTIE
ncbi:MAG: rRNA maturation RNase YbeY [Sulfurovum sp.]|nr:rRNA maturation RNase YbeY [Sulfurovum sp.]